VFLESGQQILHRSTATSEQLPELSPELQRATDSGVSQNLERYLVFGLAKEHYALSAHAILAVASQQAVHALPNNRTSALLGLVNWNGRIIPCLQLSLHAGSSSSETGQPARTGRQSDQERSQRLLVIAHRKGPLAITVDQAIGVFSLSDADAIPVNAMPEIEPSKIGGRPKHPARGMVDLLLRWNESRVGRIRASSLQEHLDTILSS
jgi:chemotaxis signal transduction protein